MPDPLAQLERMLAEATPRPWQTKREDGDWAVSADEGPGWTDYITERCNQGEKDAALIVALVNAAPHLIEVASQAEGAMSAVTHAGLRNALAGLRVHLGETEA